ncbi:MAG: hypothetical protein ACREYF_29260 [Gammaproteobacteria bacterium]
MNNKVLAIAIIVLGAGILALVGCEKKEPSVCGIGAGNIKDEALCVGRTAETLPGADEDYFQDMDYGVSKDPQAVAAVLDAYVPGISPEDAAKAVAKGRNNWIVWTAGNDRLWDTLAGESRGNLDLLKVLSNHPSLKFSRDNRWQWLGLVNEPCFEKGTEPRQDRYGLRMDVRQADCPPDPFENEEKYPGVKIGARGKNVPLGSYYGYATGIVGLRLFPNPNFDDQAEQRWDPERYFTDPSYYNDKKLVRPYRVGMSCGFCHVGPNPSKPPQDPDHPKWENLNSNPGAQYFWVDRIFTYDADPSSFAFQLFHTSRPGGLDTSFVSTDYINNPRTMNAVYNLGPRMRNALRFGEEKLGGGSLDNAQLNDYVPAGTPLTKFFRSPDTVWTPRVLKDGADSVGALGALNRVFINIGLFSEEWLEHFRPLVGGRKISPIPIKVARENSAFWVANEKQTPDLALFFLATAKPDYLKAAPGGAAYLSDDTGKLTHGKEVFAQRCARCHSSKLPEKTYSFFPSGCNGPNYLDCWNKYWAWTKTDEFKQAMKEIVVKDDFLKDNFLSTDLRVPVTLLETNACSPLATNAIADNIWDNFSSDSYKSLPSVGTITVHHPITGEPRPYTMPAGGRGYTRPASLISLWSTAPYLLNNTVGGAENFYWSGSVADRMKSFEGSIEKMLWPQKRDGNRKYMTASGKELPGVIDVTTHRSYLRVAGGYLPDFLQPLLGVLHRWLPFLFGEGGIEIGPIPSGTPINLISNMNLDPANKIQTVPVLIKLKRALKALPPGASDAEALQVFRERELVDPMLKVNKCPDFVVNRGHYFGTDYFKEEPGLSDDDKRALIEFLKTF